MSSSGEYPGCIFYLHVAGSGNIMDCLVLDDELLFLIFEQAIMWVPGAAYSLLVSIPYISRELRRRNRTVANFLEGRERPTTTNQYEIGDTITTITATTRMAGAHLHGVQYNCMHTNDRNTRDGSLANYVFGKLHGSQLRFIIEAGDIILLRIGEFVHGTDTGWFTDITPLGDEMRAQLVEVTPPSGLIQLAIPLPNIIIDIDNISWGSWHHIHTTMKEGFVRMGEIEAEMSDRIRCKLSKKIDSVL